MSQAVITLLKGILNKVSGTGEDAATVQLTGATIQQPIDIQSIFTELVASSTTTLDVSATYTSATIDMQDGDNACSRLVVNFASDQDGTLSLETSLDGTTWHTIAAGESGKLGYIDSRIALRYVRVVVKNGTTAQTKNLVVATRMVM